MTKLLTAHYPVFYKPYIDILDQEMGLLDLLDASLELFEKTLYHLKKEKFEYRYQPGKWSIKEIVQHLTDTERVFVYRALRFSRKDQKPLSGFEQDSYVANYAADKRNFNALLDEFCLLRRATMMMFQDFDDHILDLSGTVEGNSITVRALGYICSGHVMHHLKVIEERYL